MTAMMQIDSNTYQLTNIGTKSLKPSMNDATYEAKCLVSQSNGISKLSLAELPPSHRDAKILVPLTFASYSKACSGQHIGYHLCIRMPVNCFVSTKVSVCST